MLSGLLLRTHPGQYGSVYRQRGQIAAHRGIVGDAYAVVVES